MIKVCLCYNDKLESFKDEVQQIMEHYPEIVFEAYDEDYSTEKKKSYSVKGHFAAKVLPFCGVFEDDEIKKGFYSEVGECTIQAIANYMLSTYPDLRIELPPKSPVQSGLDKLLANYKNLYDDETRSK